MGGKEIRGRGVEVEVGVYEMVWRGGVRHNLAVDKVGIEMSWRLEID